MTPMPQTRAAGPLRRARRALAAVLALLPLMAQAATGVPSFPGVRDAPDPGDLNYGGYFQSRQHQPVKIVFAVSEPVQKDLVESLHNAALSLQYLKLKHIDYQIEFVLYGNGVRAADPLNQAYANLGDLMEALHEQGVRFVACFNSMDEVGMHKGDVYPFMTLVPAGILEIARRQAEGYAYIHNS